MNSLSRHLLLVLCLGAFLGSAGCRRKPAPSPVAPAEPAAEPVTPAPQPGQPPPAAVTTRASNDAAYVQELTETLNNFLGDYIKQHKRIPKDINEMVSLKIITSIPVLPGGRKWVIDQQTGKISAQ